MRVTGTPLAIPRLDRDDPALLAYGHGSLERFLSDLLVQGQPERLPQPADPPVAARAWAPHPERAGAPPACVVLTRHPDLSFAFQDADVAKISRHRRPWGSGIPKEFTSAVTGKDVFAASSLEFDGFRALELDGTNTGYVQQPFTITYLMDGRRTPYTPDALVRRPGGLECLEYKFEADAVRLGEKFARLGFVLGTIGLSFTVLTELSLRSAPLHRNIHTVMEARHCRPPRERADRLIASLWAGQAHTVGSAMAAFSLERAQILFLVRHGRLAMDLHAAPIGENSPVCWSGRGSNDPWAPRR